MAELVTYGGVPRRFSPLYVDVRYRLPNAKPNRDLYTDVRMDVDTLGAGGGLRLRSRRVKCEHRRGQRRRLWRVVSCART